MSDIIVDGRTAVWFLPWTPDLDLAALTLADMATATKISPVLVPTGLEGFDVSQAEVDNSSMESTFDSKLPGRASLSGTGLVVKKQAITDPVYALLTTENTEGVVVVRDEILATTAVAADQDYEAFPVRTGIYNKVGRGESNAVLKYRVPTPVSGPRVSGSFVTA